jgi:hypothetical protein
LHTGCFKDFGATYPDNPDNPGFGFLDTADVFPSGGGYFKKAAASKISTEINAVKI